MPYKEAKEAIIKGQVFDFMNQEPVTLITVMLSA